MILFKPNEHTEDYQIRKTNDELFVFETVDKEYFYLIEKVITFETDDKIEKYSLDILFIDIIFPHAYGEENIHFMLHQIYILFQEYETSTLKNDYEYFYKKYDELKGDNITNESEGIVKKCNDFTNCKIIHSKH